MISQKLVDDHADRVLKSVNALSQEIRSAASFTVSEVVDHIVNSVSLTDRISHESARQILGIEEVFRKALDASGYHEAIIDFVFDFSLQLNEFDTFFGSSFPPLNSEDLSVLSSQMSRSMVFLEAASLRVREDLKITLGRSIGVSKQSTLIKDVSEGIRKLNRVEPIAKDQLMLFFRTLCKLMYDKVESGICRYVGPGSENNREFCSSLVGTVHSMNEIGDMDNEQVGDAFLNCGGYGCQHWWAAEV